MTQELPEGTVTVLFTDVEGSTDLTTRLGDEAAREVLRACDELVRQQVARHRGQEVKSIGDGLMVAFQSARRAVACAVDIQRAMADYNATLLRQAQDEHIEPVEVRVRIGLNTGEVIREEADLFGVTVAAAARIASHAKAGEILISDAVKGVLGAATTVQLEDQGEVELKGFPEPMRLFRVSWEEEAAGPAGLRLPERTPFVGREAERADLRRLLQQAARGQGALVMIGGEPGVGKTRLAEELLLEARQRGVLAWTGHCYEMEGAPPYIPFVEILKTATRVVPPAALREALGDAAPEVAKLLPELSLLFSDIPPPLELPPEQERRYLFSCMLEFIERASRAQPLLLTLEDLHWADDSTLLLLQHIAQQVNQMPILILGTYRQVELDVSRSLARALEELLRQRLAHDLALKRLPEADVHAMLRALSGQEPPVPLVQAVYRETEGNPFFVEEVFKHLSEEGKLLDAEGRWRSDLRIGELDVPRGVRLVIGRRLERVSEDCRRVLTAAAVIGRAFSFELLEALGDPSTGSGQGADALLDAIDEAERAHLVNPTSDGREARFTFAHELIRQTLVSSLSLPRRQRLHLRVAEAMERVYARAMEEHTADLAHHLYQAGAAADPEKAVHFLVLAGEQAMAAAAFEDALRLYESALSLQPADDRRGRAELLYNRGLALRSLGRWDDAVADWWSAVEVYEELGDTDTVGRICARMTAQALWAVRLDEAMKASRRGLSALPEGVSADRCRLLAISGLSHSFFGEYYEGDSLITQGAAMAEELGDQALEGRVFADKASHHWYYMQTGEQLEAVRRAVERLRESGRVWELADALWVTQSALYGQGRFDEVTKIGEEAEPLAARLGHLGAHLTARRFTNWARFMITGDIGSFEEFARSDLELCRSANMPWIANSYGYLGLACFWAGRWEEAVKNLEEAVRLEPPGFAGGSEWGYLFVAKAYAGDRDAALAMLSERRAQLPRSGVPNLLGAWAMLFGVVEGLAVLDERDEAAKLYAVVLEAIDTGAVVFWLSPMLHSVAGMAAAAGGQWDKAEEHYETALRQAHELPHRIQQPEVRRWYARMLIDRNAPGDPSTGSGQDPSTGSGRDRDKARQLLTEAIAMYRDIGMPKHVEMAEELLSGL